MASKTSSLKLRVRSIVCNAAVAIFLALQERPVTDANGFLWDADFGVPIFTRCD
jgi:hypothetical protein